MAVLVGCVCQGTGYSDILVGAIEKSAAGILKSRAFPLVNYNFSSNFLIPRMSLIGIDDAIKALKHYTKPASFYGIQFHVKQEHRASFSMIVQPMNRFTYLSFDFGFEKTVLQHAEARFASIVGVKPDKLQAFSQNVGNTTRFKFKAYTIGVIAFWIDESNKEV